MNVTRPLHILLLCHFEQGTASTILEHIQAFPRFSKNRYYVLNNLGDLPWWLDLARFDGVIVHYSLIAAYDNYVSPSTRLRLREFSGFKAVFVQDDYRWINDTVDTLAYMRINALFGLAGQDIIDSVYPPERLPGVRRETVLTGYVPEDLTQRVVPPLTQRPIDVGYRARKLPAWIGSHTLQKWQIADKFKADADTHKLTVDISYREEDRIYGEDWIQFVSRCKAVLGTESGASVCDFTGEIQRNVEAHVKRDPTVSFDTLRKLYFEEVDGQILMNVISPRCFEAAALRTLMVLYEGFYSGVLQPWRHYVPLKTDHSNMADVVRLLRQPDEAQAIVDCAYREVALNPAYTFKALVERVDRVIADVYATDQPRDGYSAREFSWRLTANRHDLTRYATIASVPNTVDPSPRPLMRKRSEPTAVLPRQPGPPPHAIELVLFPSLKVRALHLVWGSRDACAVSGEVHGLRRRRTVFRRGFRSEHAERYSTIDLNVGRRTDRLCIRFDRYYESDMLDLHDLRIDAEIHWIEALRQIREKIKEAVDVRLTPFINDVWMRIPRSVRSRLRRPVRVIYDTIVRRRD